MRSITFVAALVACLLVAPAAHAATGWRWPVEGSVITPYRNGGDPYAAGQHRGIDIAAPVGARVVAASGGMVTFAGVAGSSGLTVAIRTDDGRFDTAYLHLSSVAVRRGDHLAVGDPLGAVGTSGRRSVAEPHLHFGVREAGSRFAYRDPLDFLPVAPPSNTPPAKRPIPVAAPAPARLVPTPRVVRVQAPAIGAPILDVGAPAEHAAPRATPSRARGSSASGPRMVPSPHLAAPTRSLGLSRVAAPTPRSEHHARTTAHEHSAATPRPSRAPGAAAAPDPAAGPRPHTRSKPVTLSAAQPRAVAHRPRTTGIDVGWLVACLGMVAVATLLARPTARTRSVRRAFQPEVSRQ